MRSTYAELFRTGGTAQFSAAGFVARMPISMLGISVILLVSGVTGAYTTAGLLSAAEVFAGAVAMPQIARLVDRLGQARVVRPALLVHAVGISLFVLAIRFEWPVWTWFVFVVLFGATYPAIGSMVRARWAHVLPGRLRQTAFALEAVLDEVIFVFGPPLATLLATAVLPEAGLLAALVFALAGGWIFTSLRTTEPPLQAPGEHAPRGAVVSTGMFAVCATFVGCGLVFGSIEVTIVAFAGEQGVRAASGLLLAAYAGGSLVAGLVYGTIRWKRSLPDRFLIAALFFGVAASLPLLAPTPIVLAPVVFLAGFSIAPVLIGGMALVERIVPKAALTEGLTWATTAITVGVTAGAAVAGVLIDSVGADLTFLLPAGAAVFTAVVSVIARPWLRRTPSESPGSGEPEPGIAHCDPAAPMPGQPVEHDLTEPSAGRPSDERP